MPRSRRNFIKSSAGIALFIGATGGLTQLVSCKNVAEAAKQATKMPLTSWVFLAENGDITIYNPAAEMGQGAMTALPIIFAEEMDADWDKVKVEFSPQAHTIIGDGDNLLASGIKNEFYYIPNQLGELRIVEEGVRIKHWGGVGHGPNKFAIESMIDEVAIDQGKDPVDFRRNLMKDSPRALATLEKAAAIANWGKPTAENRAKGVAFLERSGTLSTGICEISLDKNTGTIKVHHFWTANDCGVVVQPDNANAQMEGGIVMGLSSVFKEQLTIKNGQAEQSNFHDYELLRMEDVPDSIENVFIASSEHPQGVGESGTPLVAGAIANAFAALTGKRLRHLPFTPERVLSALNA